MEYLDIVDDNGNPTGQVEEREVVHEKGLQFRSSHVWVFRKKDSGIQVLLQKRARHKSSYPGCYDISSAGHVPAGMGYLENAVKELGEELGLCVKEEQLIECGLHRMCVDTEFYGKRFIDRQVAMVYILWHDMEEEAFCVQEEEVEYVRWFEFEDCVNRVKGNQFLHCIDVNELELLRRSIKTINLGVDCDMN